MSEATFYRGLLIAWFVLAAATLPTLFFIPAPYGRHTRGGWGPVLDNKLGWILMESPAALVFAACFAWGQRNANLVAWIFCLLWETHYVRRAFIYPLLLRGGAKRMTLSIALLGLLFNTGNGYLNGRWLFALSGGYPLAWLTDPRFLLGLVLFGAGFIVNTQADRALRRLRAPGESGYKIPYGGLFRWVSCPNYLGEVVEWIGWAIATWSWAGLAFAVWVAANLVPRAQAHHRWYRTHFPDYPPERKALLPGVW